MRITLHTDEIAEALKAYVAVLGINLEGKDVEITSFNEGFALDVTAVTATKKTVSAVTKVAKPKLKEASPVAAKDTSKSETTTHIVEAKLEEKEAEEVPANSKSLFA
jgi:hypothetical protein